MLLHPHGYDSIFINVTSKDITSDKKYFQFEIALPHQKPIYRKSERIKVSDTIKTIVTSNNISHNGILYDISEKWTRYNIK